METITHLLVCQEAKENCEDKIRKYINAIVEMGDDFTLERKIIEILKGPIDDKLCTYFRNIEIKLKASESTET